ncbi:formyltetrahydrofolate deformylase, partial [Klebsiella pneumoniae]|nr:formyltetrahydrofolate deformylase [Klebsiella pneumoniae]HCT5406290.1 formyltetrahydrofolate deformylase [Klebsiella pneumoniae]
MHSLQRKVLRTICPDQKGLIARITNICYKHEL